jgi:hypothetical protein
MQAIAKLPRTPAAKNSARSINRNETIGVRVLSSWVALAIGPPFGWSKSRGQARTLSSARFYGVTKIMKKSIMVAPKRRGRPPTGGRDPLLAARVPQELINRIEKWARLNGISRSEAVRRLIEHSLP